MARNVKVVLQLAIEGPEFHHGHTVTPEKLTEVLTSEFERVTGYMASESVAKIQMQVIQAGYVEVPDAEPATVTPETTYH